MSASSQPAVLFTVDGGVGQLTLNRPASYNAFNRDMALALQAALKRCADDDRIRAVHLTGAGKAFCSGQDLKEAARAEAADIDRLLGEQLHPVVEGLRRLEKPVVGALNGLAAGAGASIALACDITVAAHSAKLVQAFVRIGLIPDSGGTWLLPRLVGWQRAAGLMMLGEPIAAQEAADMGMIYRVFPDASFAEESLELARRLAQLPTRAIGLTKRALARSLANTFEQQLDQEMALQREAIQTDDFREGLQAFLEKRPPRFSGH